MIQHELLPHTTAHRVTEDVAYIYMYEINENCGHGEQNIRTKRLYGELDKKWPSWTSWAEPSHARAEPELSSAQGSTSLAERDVSSAQLVAKPGAISNSNQAPLSRLSTSVY